MQEFTYTIQDKDGIHARPAGALIRAAMKFKSDITLSAGDRAVSLKGGIFALMGMGIRYGTIVTVTCSGEDEKEACKSLKTTLSELL